MTPVTITRKLLLATGCLAAWPALAQTQPNAPAPAAQEEQSPQLTFPQLPPSRKCAKQDITGVWRLRQVYELPVGNAALSWARQPFQYLFFRPNDTYGQYIGRAPLSIKDAPAKITQQKTPLMQYLLKDGFLYFYQAGVATDTQACFIVTAHRQQANFTFDPGQMLIMPPQGQSRTRVVKHYDKFEPAPAPAPAKQAPQQQKQPQQGARR